MMETVLITNDDGIEAPGMAALVDLAREMFREVWVFAPAKEASQIGHRVTTNEPLHFEERGIRQFAIHGAPADCVRAGFHLMGVKPDWVWSGINHGGNLGRHDYFISGTLAAAREAAFHGVKAMGASQFLRGKLDWGWELGARRVQRAFLEIHEEETPPGAFWSINLPHEPPGGEEPKVVFCEQERQPLDVRFEESDGHPSLVYSGSYHDRPRTEGSDVDVCFGGSIAVSRVEI